MVETEVPYLGVGIRVASFVKAGLRTPLYHAERHIRTGKTVVEILGAEDRLRVLNRILAPGRRGCEKAYSKNV